MATSRRKWLKTGAALTAGCLAPSLPAESLAQGAAPDSGSAGAPRNTGAATATKGTGDGATPSAGSTQRYGAANLGLGITRRFGAFLSGIRFEDLPADAVHEARRAVLDWIGCALAGSHHPTPRILIRTLAGLGSMPDATVLGHKELKLGLLDAAVANGQMGHVLDFDDTHLGGVILHTSTASLPALFALGERRRCTGKEIIVALVAAFESGIRTGQAMPRHHQGGWHLTGTLGTVAATAGCARLLSLDPTQTVYALGIGCTQAAGMQQNRGSDCKSLHAGKSAYHGVLAASLAANGFNSSAEILEGSLGFVRIYSATQNIEAITDGLGKRWAITGNGYKPYACGVVLHPLIDAAIGASREGTIPPQDVTAIEMLVHPDVVRITGIDTPGSGLMSKFSANHAAAVAYIDKAGGVQQFSNDRAQDAQVQDLRKKVVVRPSQDLRLDQAVARVTSGSGSVKEMRIDHATGTVQNPMSDRALEAKFMGNAEGVIPREQAREIVELVWRLESVSDIGELLQRCR